MWIFSMNSFTHVLMSKLHLAYYVKETTSIPKKKEKKKYEIQ